MLPIPTLVSTRSGYKGSPNILRPLQENDDG